MSHFPKVYPFSLFQYVVTYTKKTVRKNNFVTFDIQLLQEKTEKVHLCFSVSTENNHDNKTFIRLGFESIKSSELNNYDVFKLKNVKAFTLISVIFGGIYIQQFPSPPFSREIEYSNGIL